MTQKEYKCLIAILLICSIVVVIWMGYSYHQINDNLKYQGTYEFRLNISPEGKFYIHKSMIIYDFENESGNLSFTFSEGTEDVRPHPITITIAKELNISDIEINKSYSKLVKGDDYVWRNHTVIGPNVYEVVLDDFKKSVKGYTVLVKFNGKLIPNALFNVDFNVVKAQTKQGDFFNFIMGDYTCSSPPDCFSSSRDKYEGKLTHYFYKQKEGAKILEVYKRDENGTELNPSDEEFYLKLGQKEKLINQKKGYRDFLILLVGFIISFVFQLLFYLLESKKDFFEENKDKIEEHKKHLIEKIKETQDYTLNGKEELKNLLRVKSIKSLREISKKENLNVNDNDKLELVFEIIEARKKKKK